MQYDVEVNGRVRQVVVHPAGDRYVVSVDGQEFNVDAARVDGYMMSLLVGHAESHEVTVSPDAATKKLAVRVGPMRVLVGMNGRRRFGQRGESADTGTGPQRILAPMPGKVVRVLVKPGDPIQARQPVVVVEAMKMENELRAARDGVVADVHVREGASVEAGALLVVVQ